MENNYSIQEYQESDVGEMIALGAMMHREGAYHYLPYVPEKLYQLDRDIRLENRTLGNGWVAKFEGKIIGMYVAYITQYFFCNEKIGCDYFFYVHPDYRNRWPMLAIKLVKRAERWAKLNGALEFSPATSVMIAPKVSKVYEFLKYDIIGNLFKKKL
mgnify:FL=1|jgi:GNAT superfamily N-acetyltransferase|tara:strand:- start:744 stop:1214 length:471 start_codon:yes stop_codon:yes gene_type:complete